MPLPVVATGILEMHAEDELRDFELTIGPTIRVEVPALVAVPCPHCGARLLLSPEEADDLDGYAIVCTASRLPPGSNARACSKPFDEDIYRRWLDSVSGDGGGMSEGA